MGRCGLLYWLHRWVHDEAQDVGERDDTHRSHELIDDVDAVVSTDGKVHINGSGWRTDGKKAGSRQKRVAYRWILCDVKRCSTVSKVECS